MIRRRARLVIVVVVGYVVIQEPFEFVKWTVLARVMRWALSFVRLSMMIVLYCSTFVIAVLLSRGRHIHRGDYGTKRVRR